MNSDYQDMSLFDFIVLCIKKLKAFFVSCLNALCNIVHVGVKHWYITCVLVILGVLYVHFYRETPAVTYKGEATILFPGTMKPSIERGLRLFENLEPAGKGLNDDQVAAFRELKFFNVIDARGDGSVDFTDKTWSVKAIDSIQFVMMDRLTIELALSDRSAFDAYQKAITDYFDQRDEYSAPAKRWKESVERKIAYINRVIESSDSLNVELFDTREALMESLSGTPDVVNFQTHFAVSTVAPVEQLKLRYITLIALALGMVLAYVIEYRKKILQFIKNKR